MIYIEIQIPPFYVGVEYAYGYNNETAQIQLAEVKSLVDKVKDYTNLFVIGSLGLTFDREALTEACDYIVNANLNLLVLFTGLTEYSFERLGEKSYNTTDWMIEAKARYGDRFVGIYRYDEPGGNQLDQGPSALVNETEVKQSIGNLTYTNVADHYVANLKIFPNNYLMFTPKIFTADYGLYWFDYSAAYSAIFAEFVGNESRERHIALCRGAADAFNKDWGAIINWKYNQYPYLESPEELYNDLALAYRTGAKYAIVFSYPKINSSNYGILSEGHFRQLQRFWVDIHHNPEGLGSSKPEVAYILPANYGFGFRSPEDTIWGLFPADELSQKVYSDIEELIANYGSNFDILYDQPPLTSQSLKRYSEVFFWNQTINLTLKFS
jgi:hypothetical protein